MKCNTFLFVAVLSFASTSIFAQTRPNIQNQQAAGGEMRGVIGELNIGIVDASNPGLMSFNVLKGGSANLYIDGSSYAPDGHHTSYAIAVEIAIADVVVDNVVSKTGTGTVFMFDVTAGALIPLTTGPQILLVGQRYMFRGDSGAAGDFSFSMTWAEIVGPPEGADIFALNLSGHATLHSIDDEMTIRTADSGNGSLTIIGPGELWMMAIGNVSSPTLTLPPNGIEGNVVIPTGTHDVNLNGFGIFFVDFWNPAPEDINMDGVVDVLDLLAVISAWSIPMP